MGVIWEFFKYVVRGFFLHKVLKYVGGMLFCCDFFKTRSLGGYAPLLLAPPEGFEDNWHKKEYGEYGY